MLESATERMPNSTKMKAEKDWQSKPGIATRCEKGSIGPASIPTRSKTSVVLPFTLSLVLGRRQGEY